MTRQLFLLEDNEFWDESKEALEDLLDTLITYPVSLRAVNSNWQGQTGIAEADNFEELIHKCFNFGNDYLDLYESSIDGLYFSTASHDVPTGFNIYLQEFVDE